MPKIPFLQIRRSVPLKTDRAKHLEESCNHLALKLKLAKRLWLFALKLTDMVVTLKFNFMLLKLSQEFGVRPGKCASVN